MKKIRYRGDHQEFLQELFSDDFIVASKITAQIFIEQLFSDIAIEKKVEVGEVNDDDEIEDVAFYPTHLFSQLNYACGDRNPDLDVEIYDILSKLKPSSEEILSLLLADMISMDEDMIRHLVKFERDDSDEIKEVSIEKFLADQHDELPYYLHERLRDILYNFASEFDLSDGTMTEEDFKYYSDRHTGYLQGNPISRMFL